LILGHFNAHHTSWGDHSIDQQGGELMEAMDEVYLTHLNDATLTRVPCPPSRDCAVDLSLTHLDRSSFAQPGGAANVML
jgi:hypothetical protein